MVSALVPGALGVAKAVAQNFMKSLSLTTFNGVVHTRAQHRDEQ